MIDSFQLDQSFAGSTGGAINDRSLKSAHCEAGGGGTKAIEW